MKMFLLIIIPIILIEFIFILLWMVIKSRKYCFNCDGVVVKDFDVKGNKIWVCVDCGEWYDKRTYKIMKLLENERND
jgi:hypothetical protein